MASAKLYTSLSVLYCFNVAQALQLAAPLTSSIASNVTLHSQLDQRQHGAESGPTPTYLGGPKPQCGFDTRLMAECMDTIYSKKNFCGCWNKVKSYTNPSQIRIAIYHQSNQCLLAISGQMNGAEQFKNNALKYMTKHDPLLHQSLCGRPTVRGFAMQARKLFGDFEWASFVHFLTGNQCSGGVGVLGTSWGGAIAEILSGCANQGHLGELQAAGLPTFEVDQLFTFGAPPSALMPIYNHQADSNACFRGQRVFLSSNTAEGPTDLISYSTGFNAFQHPRMDAIQIIKMANGHFDVKLHPCHSQGTISLPAWGDVAPVIGKIWSEHAAAPLAALGKYVVSTHSMAVYVKSLYNVEDPAKLERRDVPGAMALAKVDVDGMEIAMQKNETSGPEGVRNVAAQISDVVAKSLGAA